MTTLEGLKVVRTRLQNDIARAEARGDSRRVMFAKRDLARVQTRIAAIERQEGK